MPQSDIQKLAQEVIAFRDARDWKKFHNPKDAALSLTLEVAEVLEHFQWKNGAELKKYVKAHKNEIAEELIDVLYWILLMSHDLKIDIPKTFEKKMRKNEKRYPVAKVKGKHHKYTHYQ